MDEEIRKIFSENLVRLMNERGKTQADLYRYMDVSSATASDWCTGKKMPRMDKINSIANWLVVDITDLLTEHSEEKQNYYLNDDSRELVQFLFDNPDYKVLFDAYRKVKVEDIEKVKQMIDLMCGDE